MTGGAFLADLVLGLILIGGGWILGGADGAWLSAGLCALVFAWLWDGR